MNEFNWMECVEIVKAHWCTMVVRLGFWGCVLYGSECWLFGATVGRSDISGTDGWYDG